MRGCLSVILIAAAFVVGLIWFAGPPLASSVVTVGLQSTGLSANRLDVKVTADPPFELATGRADSVAIHAASGRWRGVRFASLDVTLAGVDLVGRTATTAQGRLDGVVLDTAGGETVLADVELAGPGAAAATTIRIDATTVETVTLDAFDAHFGVRPTSANLVAPDTVRVVLDGLTVDGRLSIGSDGSVVARARGDAIVLFTPNAALPLRVRRLAVTASGLTLHGTLDVGALVR